MLENSIVARGGLLRELRTPTRTQTTFSPSSSPPCRKRTLVEICAQSSSVISNPGRIKKTYKFQVDPKRDMATQLQQTTSGQEIVARASLSTAAVPTRQRLSSVVKDCESR